MKKIISGLLVLLLFNSCTKEVKIEIPGYAEKIVIDGRIETNFPPVVLLSRTNDIYSPTNLEAYLNGFISGAVLSVSDGTTIFPLVEICTDALPAGTENFAAQFFGIPVEEIANYHLCAYTSFDPEILGQVGKTYTLNVKYDGKTYTSQTTIVPPINLLNTFWKPAKNQTEYGYSWATISDNANQFDGYLWEIRYIHETSYSKPFSPFFDDQFIDGLTFDFAYENPMSFQDASLPDEFKGFYKLGDTLVVKLSKMDEAVYQFMEKKYTQLFSAGNPFATPTNIPSNINGGALGIWAGYSPRFDTLICEL